MKRPKIGDLYYVEVPNGYKLYQWAYTIPRWGDYIRVFDGLYSELPNNIDQIAAGPHSYILPFATKRLYRIGIAKLIGNYPVPEEYPFPEHHVHFDFHPESKKIIGMDVSGVFSIRDGNWGYYEVNQMKDLPCKYQNIKLINSRIGPEWLLYLFDVDFNLSFPERFSPPGQDHELALAKYKTWMEKTI